MKGRGGEGKGEGSEGSEGEVNGGLRGKRVRWGGRGWGSGEVGGRGVSILLKAELVVDAAMKD